MKKVWSRIWWALRPVLRFVGWLLTPVWRYILRPVLWMLSRIVDTYTGNGLWRHAVPLSHWCSRYIGPLFGASLIVNAAGEHLVTQWIATPVSIPLVMMALGGWRHQDYLCPRCAEDFPLDPQAESVMHIHHLKRFHRMTLLFLAAYLLLLLPSSLLSDTWLDGYGSEIVVGALFFGFILPVTRWSRIHGRLQPWCPWCHRGDDGPDDEFEPVDPDPHGIKEPVT